MTRNSKLALAAIVFAGAMAAGTAHARNNVDVQWSVTIGTPGIGIGVPIYAPPVVVRPAPVVYPVRYGYGDRDRDGIPNRYDRVYNPRWDRNGDGVPNRYDRRDDRRDDRRGHDRHGR